LASTQVIHSCPQVLSFTSICKGHSIGAGPERARQVDNQISSLSRNEYRSSRALRYSFRLREGTQRRARDETKISSRTHRQFELQTIFQTVGIYTSNISLHHNVHNNIPTYVHGRSVSRNEYRSSRALRYSFRLADSEDTLRAGSIH